MWSLPAVDEFFGLPLQKQLPRVRGALVVHLSVHVYQLPNCLGDAAQGLLVHAELSHITDGLLYGTVVLEERLIELLLKQMVLHVSGCHPHSLGFCE